MSTQGTASRRLFITKESTEAEKNLIYKSKLSLLGVQVERFKSGQPDNRLGLG